MLMVDLIKKTPEEVQAIVSSSPENQSAFRSFVTFYSRLLMYSNTVTQQDYKKLISLCPYDSLEDLKTVLMVYQNAFESLILSENNLLMDDYYALTGEKYEEAMKLKQMSY
mmetsp:Transcript_24308/g.18491  ORF Transcript_24308/g.18491 Transcript_24308/m.18491 type:complete len:111 (-) Transcript_24308:1654-1986(-)